MGICGPGAADASCPPFAARNESQPLLPGIINRVKAKFAGRHAGVIEPGHFRFQCYGENVLHLEIALGYQHRGLERMSDIAQFATKSVQDAVREQMQADPTPSTTEILLVNAPLLGVSDEGEDQYAQVFFDVLLRENPQQQTPVTVREVWHFVRPVAGGNWKLDGIQQVE